jgi:hypothetical protein
MRSTRKVPEKGKRLQQKDKQIPAEKGAPSLAVGPCLLTMPFAPEAHCPPDNPERGASQKEVPLFVRSMGPMLRVDPIGTTA